MPIEVEAPDGTILEFPENTPRETMRAAMAKRFPSAPAAQPAASPVPAAPAPRTALEQLGLGTRATVEGLGGLAYQVAAVPQNLLSNVPGLGFLRTGSLGDVLTQAGLPQPRDAGERVMGSAISGAAGALTPVGAGQALAKAAGPTAQRLAQVLSASPAQQVVMGATGGAGAQVAQEAVGEEAGPLGKAAAGVAGGLVGGFLPAAATGIARRTFGTVAPAAGVPTAEETKAAAQRAYKAAEDAGVVFTPGAMRRVADDVIERLSEFGYNPANQPQTAAVLKQLDSLQDNVVAFKGLENLRKQASAIKTPTNPSDETAARQIIAAIDDLVQNPRVGASLQSADVLSGPVAQAAGAAGDPKRAAAMISEARDQWSRLMKHQEIQDAVTRAEANAASAGSGSNLENTLRQALKSVLLDKQATRGFTADEKKALYQAVHGNLLQNTLRLLGKAAPTGVVSGGLSGGAGMVLGGPIGAAAVPAGGYLAKRAADQMERERVQRLQDLILSGGRAQNLPPSAPRGNIPALINILQQGVSP